MEVSTPKAEGKLHHARSACCISFPSVFGVDTSINPKNITTIPYHFISTLLNANFDFDVSVANDVAIDVAMCALPGKVMQWSPCPDVRMLTNGNRRYMMKLNDKQIIFEWMLKKGGAKINLRALCCWCVLYGICGLLWATSSGTKVRSIVTIVPAEQGR